MGYFFQIGRIKNLCLYEISIIFNINIVDIIDDKFVIFNSDNIEEVYNGLNKSAGIIRFGRVFCDINEFNINLLSNLFKEKSNKINIKFSVSKYYKGANNLLKLLVEVKNLFKDSYKIRYLNNLDLNNTVVVLDQIIKNGIELIFTSKIILQTLWVQDIKKDSFFDVKKPYKSMKNGVLPIKLARQMVNLCNENIIYDPFCGDGTIPIECIRQNKKIICSDISEKMIYNTNENIKWAENKLNIKANIIKIFKYDATKLNNKLFFDIDENIAIVSEGYLGVPKLNIIDYNNAIKELSEISTLYYKFLTNCFDIKKITSIVLCVPIFKTNKGNICADQFNIDIFKKTIKYFDYFRNDQFVMRRIYIFKN